METSSQLHQRKTTQTTDNRVIDLSGDGKLTKTIISEGNGDYPPEKCVATVHYIGKLQNGTQFDSSFSRNKPFQFNLGAREVILGWDKGVASMKKGEKCILKCSPDYAYGNRAVGNIIPANATLEFEVDLINWSISNNDNNSVFRFSNLISFLIIILILWYVFS